MASAWRIAGMGWGVTVLGWLLSPIIGLLLNKILSYLGFDASQKLRDLEIHTIPELKRALRKVEEQRMLRAARKESSDVDILNKQATMLRSVLYEAEDILDLIDYHQIEKKVVGDGDGESHDNSWPQCWVQRLYDAVGTGFARCNRSWMGRCGSAVLLRWARQSLSWLGRCVAALHRSAALLPISCPPSVSLSSVQRIRCWSGSFDFNNCCRSIFVWSANAIEDARSYRNWSYHEVGITSYQEDGIAVDSFLPTIARWNLKKRIEKLENIVTGMQKSHLLNQERSSAPNDIANMNRRSIRSIAARKVFGRDEERNMITNMLREGPDEYAPSSSSSKCYSAIGIYGIAGSGKTTLAEYVCDYEKEDTHFSPIMCIYVSETFSVEDIFHDMLVEITNDRHSNITDRKVLKARLQEQLRDKRFLLVLDDLWDVNRQELEELLSPLNVGRRGSKILVTSRREDAPLVAKRPIAISDLNEEQYFSMFMHYALDDTSVDDREYIKIGREIVKNLHKSPIAAVTVAGQLWRNPDLGFWGTVANLDLLNQTRGALWWSYQQLDEDVRRCFEYCSIFPRRYELERDKLVHMWIAQGFVKATKASEDIEDVGKSYFRQLQSCSFLQLKRRHHTFGEDISSGEYFTVHDLLHELAERVAGSDCLKIERGIVGKISHDVRHLYIESYGKTVLPEQIFQLKNLRTLILRCSVKRMSKEDLERVFMSLEKLRVVHLELRWLELETIPGCIGQLKHLRYLDIFGHVPINMTLPAEFTKLYHLQVFSVPPDTHLHFSSEEKMANLINLRTWYGLNFPDVGRLTSLQNLHRFHVRNKRGYEIQQLEHLNKLRGKLYIKGLENVKSKEEALQAKLAGKKHLTQLALRWGGVDENSRLEKKRRTCHQSCSPELQAEVLKGLHPPSQITSLSIRDYGGLRYPSWLSGDRVLLRVLDLEGCKGLEKVLDDVCEFLFLKYLSLRGSDVPRIPKTIGKLYNLETLDIRETPVEILPMEVIMLPNLVYLFGQFELPLPHKPGEKRKLQNFLSEKSKLHTLAGFVTNKTQDFENIILCARRLRKVKVWCNDTATPAPRSTPAPSPAPSYNPAPRTIHGPITKELTDIFVSSLESRLTDLESLSIDSSGLSKAFLSHLKDPCAIHTIKLRGKLERLPHSTTLSELRFLTVLHLLSTGLRSEDLSVLQSLCYLEYLKLVEDGNEFGDGSFVVQSYGFPSLLLLWFELPKLPRVQIEQGAMTNLSYLQLLCREFADVLGVTDDIVHLERLNEVVLHPSVGHTDLEAWERAANQHQNRPRVKKQPTA